VHGQRLAGDTGTNQDEGRARGEADAAEAVKREHRTVLALNKLGDAAMGVRREFVRKLLARLVDCTTRTRSDVRPARYA
jgi:hypothetical protein